MSIEFQERKRWLFFGLPFTFTKYYVKDDMLTVRCGLFNITENDCYMYKIQDVQLSRTFWERLFRIGTVNCITGDNTSPQLQLKHVRHAGPIKDYILKASEEARIKRRTVNMLDIGSGEIADADDSIL